MEGEVEAIRKGDSQAAVVLESWAGRVRRGDGVAGIAARLGDVVCPALTAYGLPSVHEAAGRVLASLADKREGRAAFLDPQHAAVLSAATSRDAPPQVRELISRCLHRSITMVADGTGIADHLEQAFSSGAVAVLFATIDDPEVAVACKAGETLAWLVAAGPGRARLAADDAAMQKLKDAIRAENEVSLRILDGLGEAGAHNREAFVFLRELGVLDSIANGVAKSTTDLLLLLNYLEVLELICRSPLGVEFCGTRPDLGDRIVRLAEQDVSAPVCGFALRFIGNFARHSAENAGYALRAGWYDVAVKHKAVDKGLESLAGLACRVPTLLRMLTTADFSAFTDAVAARDPTMQETGLHCLAQPFEAAAEPDADAAHREAAEQLFTDALLRTGYLKKAVSLRSHSITSVRLAALRLIAALASNSFTVNHLTSDQVLWDYILDPNIELDMMCKETKFGAIQKLVKYNALIKRPDKEIAELESLGRAGPWAVNRKLHAPNTEVAE
ncbi:hypothetical protein DIPPA_35636 [Diplonema papillatum]|nr:hypothetical protein DIPPA_35636 [Diplonema papillatum]